jgi:hypothetical protein
MAISSKKLNRIIDEWEENDECILVESKLNYTAKSYL